MKEKRFMRQTFLGKNTQRIIDDVTVGILGLGGGGSHIVQQLAHIGVKHYVLFDPDQIEDTNLNRLVGATESDVISNMPKIDIAKRMILGLQSKATIQVFKSRWQDNPNPLKACDLIFGCVDSYLQRRDIEVFARRYLIPYIDIGMDVHKATSGGKTEYGISGQVIASIPGGPCMTCIGYLTEEKLAKEATKYGDVGGRPQVVWPNGVLASTAVGLAIDLLTGWTRTSPKVVYLSYRGNDGTICPHERLKYIQNSTCNHFPLEQAGEPVFRPL